MAEVYLWAGAKKLIEADYPLTVDGETVGDLLKNLVIMYPNLRYLVKEGVSCSVDDKLIFNSSTEAVGKNSEVFIFQKISGG